MERWREGVQRQRRRVGRRIALRCRNVSANRYSEAE